ASPWGASAALKKSPRWRCTWPATNRPSPPARPRSSTAAGPTEPPPNFIHLTRTPYSMKLLRHGAKGAEKPALLDAEGRVRDLSGIVADITADTLAEPALARLRALDPASLPVVEQPGRLAPPWAGMGKFICIGLNYADHAR